MLQYIILLLLLSYDLDITLCQQQQQTPIVGHLFVIMFENQSFKNVLSDSNWAEISSKGLTLTNMYALTHPSQPNYIAQLAGDMFTEQYGNYRDSNVDIDAINIIDLLEQQGITWTAYAEDYEPLDNGMCNTVANINHRYYRKHVPHMSFIDISTNIDRCQKIVNAKRLDDDIANNNLSQFIYYTPNILNDCHDTGYTFCGQYLAAWLYNYWQKLPADTLIILAYDEDDYTQNNKIANILLGPYIDANTTDNTYFNQYSFTRLFEDLYHLPSLNRNDVSVSSLYQLIKPLSNERITKFKQVVSTLNKVDYPVPNFVQRNYMTIIIASVVASVLMGLLLVVCIGLYCYRRYKKNKTIEHTMLLDDSNDRSDASNVSSDLYEV